MATALVTGGTSGIGAEFARQLAASGYDLVLVARDQARLKAIADELHAANGIDVELLPADLSKRTDVDRVAKRLSDQERPIEFLVNNAGFGVHGSLLSEDTTGLENASDVMVLAVLVLGGAAGRAMKLRGHGTILNVGSTASFLTMGAYSAIKSWVHSYSEGLAVELRGTGVNVTVLAPGWVRTEFHQRAGIRTGSIPDFMWLDAKPLVATALKHARRGKVISIPTVRYGFLMGLLRHAPRRAVRAVSGAVSSSRNEGEQSAAPVDPNSSVATTGQEH